MTVQQMLHSPRLPGRTTRQIAEAPQNCVYVWPNPDTGYPKMLARELNRADITFVSPSSMRDDYLCGVKELVLDHATRLTHAQWLSYKYWQKRKAAQS